MVDQIFLSPFSSYLLWWMCAHIDVNLCVTGLWVDVNACMIFWCVFAHVDVYVCVYVCVWWGLSGVSPGVAPGQAGRPLVLGPG